MKFVQQAQLSYSDSFKLKQKMNHTKDQITINISKKAKIWLSVILCVILMAAITIILVHRHYQLLERNSAPTEQEDQSSGSQNNYIDGVDLQTCALNQVLHLLDDVGDSILYPYHTWFGCYFDNNNIVDKTKANLTQSRYNTLDNHAQSMLQIYQRDYTSQLKTLSASTIDDSPDFYTAIEQLKDLINNAT